MSGIHQLLLVLLMTSYVVVCVNGHSCIGLRRLTGDRRSYVDRRHSVFKRATTLDDSSASSAIIETLNSLRRQRPGVANMHYVVYTIIIVCFHKKVIHHTQLNNKTIKYRQ